MPAVALEPVLGMPTPREQLDQVLRLAAMTPNATDRVTACCRARWRCCTKAAPASPAPSSRRTRASIETRIRAELASNAATRSCRSS